MQQWIVTKYDDFGEPLLRELVDIPDPPKSFKELLEEAGEALL